MFTMSSISKAKRFRGVWRWLENKHLVVAGYFDDVKGINLLHLIQCWLEAREDGQPMEEHYPHAADHFQIRVIENIEDPRTLSDVLPDFEGCSHIKVWCLGDEIPASEWNPSVK